MPGPLARPRPSRRISLGAALALLVILAAPTAAFAQTPTRDNPFPRVEGARRWGPFLVDLSFAIDNIGYDENVFLVADDDPNREPESSWVVRLGPAIEAQTQFGPNVALTLRDRLLGEVFFSFSDLNNTDNDFEAQLDVLLGSILLTTEGQWRNSRQRPLTEIDERTKLDTARLKQIARLFIGPKTDVSASAEVQRQRYSDPDGNRRFLIDPDGDGIPIGEEGETSVSIGTALDRDQTTLGAELGWKPGGATRVFLRGEYRDYDFLSDIVLRDAEDTRYYLGLEFRPESTLSGRVELGRAELENVAEGFEERPEAFDGLVGEAQLVLRPGGRSRVTLEYELDVRFSTFDRNFYYEEASASIGVEWFLGRRWGVQAGFERRELDWPEPTTIALDQNRETGYLRSDTIDNGYAGILFRFTQGATIGLRYGRRERESNALFGNDTQNYLTTTGNFAF